MKSNEEDSDIAALQKKILEKDQQMSKMQSVITRLQIKNKESLVFESLVQEYEEKCLAAENEAFKYKELMRKQSNQMSALKKKIQELSVSKEKGKNDHHYVSKQEFTRVYDELMKTKESLQYENQMKIKLEIYQKEIADLRKDLEGQKAENKKLIENNIKKEKELRFYIDREQSKIHLESSSEKGLGFKSERELGGLQFEFNSVQKQNQQLKYQVQLLSNKIEQYQHSPSEWSTEEKNQEYIQMIKKYEQHIEAMATKLSSVHKLEMQKRKIDEERRKWKDQCDSLKQELESLRNYWGSMEIEATKNQMYREQHLERDMGKFMKENESLDKRIENLNNILKEKCEQISELKQKLNTAMKVHSQINKMEQGLQLIEKEVKMSREELQKQREKVYEEEEKYQKLQKEHQKCKILHNETKSQLSKLNRTISQKIQKIELQSIEINKLRKENEQKIDLSQKLSKLQIQHRKLEQEKDQQREEGNELAIRVIILSAQVERLYERGVISHELLEEFQSLKIKSQEIRIYISNLEERIQRLEHLHHQVVTQSMKISQHLKESQKKWNYYDCAMQRMNNFLEGLIVKSNQKFDQLDSNIQKWLDDQQKRLKEERERIQDEEEEKIN